MILLDVGFFPSWYFFLGYILCSYVVSFPFDLSTVVFSKLVAYFSFMDYVGNRLNITGDKALFTNKWHMSFHGWILSYDPSLSKWGTK